MKRCAVDGCCEIILVAILRQAGCRNSKRESDCVAAVFTQDLQECHKRGLGAVSHFPGFPYVIVRTRGLLVPPLEQPRSPEFPLGVLTVTFAVPGAGITAVVIVACNCWLLVARVLTDLPLTTTTEAETN
jgi:hypothetical protein